MSVKIFACGDIVNSTADNFIDSGLKDLIRSADLSICNLEAPIETADGYPIKKAGPHLRQNVEVVKWLCDAGFNCVSLANNHIYDYGEKALYNTLDALNRKNIKFVGAGVNFDQAYAPQIIEKEGIKIGIVAGCENEFGCLYEDQKRGGYAWLNHCLFEDVIRDLRQKADIVIVMAHAGVESIDFPIKEWRERYKRLCDVGADVIIGHHPHVPQGFEKYGKSMIFYSLGNFYFKMSGMNKENDDSYSVIVDVEKDGIKNYNVICHKRKDDCVCRVSQDKVNFNLDQLNSYLGEGYDKLNDDISRGLFEKYYYRYYEEALWSIPHSASFLEKVKHFIARILFFKKEKINRNLLLLHNIKIDSHRFVVQRALHLITQDNE